VALLVREAPALPRSIAPLTRTISGALSGLVKVPRSAWEVWEEPTRHWLVLALSAALLGCVAPPLGEAVTQMVPPGSVLAGGSPAGSGRRIVYNGAGGFTLPDGSTVAADAAGGFTLANGTYIAPDRAGGLTLPNSSRCVSDGARGYICP
jgi:hypothetical protein